MMKNRQLQYPCQDNRCREPSVGYAIWPNGFTARFCSRHLPFWAKKAEEAKAMVLEKKPE